MKQVDDCHSPLRRHQLVHLTASAWQHIVVAAPQHGPKRSALAHWAAHDLPLVVARQDPASPDQVRLGLPLPEAWGRLRVPLSVSTGDIERRATFPTLGELASQAPHGLPPAAWQALAQALTDCGAMARVYGSYGWQALTGLSYLHARSDLDLLMDVTGAAMADAVTHQLARCQPGLPRLDGELMFPEGIAVSWREWQGLRSGRSERVLRRHLDRVDLAGDEAWPQGVAAISAGVAV